MFPRTCRKNPRSDVKKSHLFVSTSIFSDSLHRTASSALGFYRDGFEKTDLVVELLLFSHVLGWFGSFLREVLL